VPSLTGKHQALGNYALGYCEHFLFEISDAAERMALTVQLLESDANDTLLELAYTGLGICHYTLCSVDAAFAAFKRGFDIADRVGNDSRSSVNAGNLSAVFLLAGDFQEAIAWGRESVLRGERALNQPMLRNALGNLTEALLLSGRVDEALKVREDATQWVLKERSWLARLLYGAEDGCHQLLLGNLRAALDIAASVERLAAGRERAVPATSSYEVLKTIRLRETDGVAVALKYAVQVTGRYANKVPLALLRALCVETWLRRPTGAATGIPDERLGPLINRAPGMRVLYQGMGLLE
jgi:tetratricopeptide (TPR) repeat protein